MIVLKKLFISLIILSALTSDASAFSAYMLSAGFSSECWLNHLEDSKILPEVAGKLYIASADEIIQSRTIQYRLILVLPENAYSNCEISRYYRGEYNSLYTDSSEIAFGSDPSPPQC